MRIRNFHSWDVTTRAAMEIQTRLRNLLDQAPAFCGKPSFIAGADVSFDKERNLVYGGVVICAFDTLETIETQIAIMESPFPYVPGLLSFREAPVLIQAFGKLKTVPDIVLCDGQGIAHPRGFGLACHLGILLDLPTIGCAKSRLCGVHDEPEREKGAHAGLVYKDKMVGMALRTRLGVKPIYLSTGYKVNLPEAKEIVLACCVNFRIPEPNRKAHKFVNACRLSDQSTTRHS